MRPISANPITKKKEWKTDSQKLGSISHEIRPLCDSGSRSRSSNGSSLRADLGSGGGRGSRSSSGVNGLLSDGLVVGAIAGDVSGLGALVADLAGGAQGTAVGGSAVAGDVTL